MGALSGVPRLRKGTGQVLVLCTVVGTKRGRELVFGPEAKIPSSSQGAL